MEGVIPLAALGFVVGGGILAAYHLRYLLNVKKDTKDTTYRITMTILGGLCVSIGANLFASTFRERFKG